MTDGARSRWRVPPAARTAAAAPSMALARHTRCVKGRILGVGSGALSPVVVTSIQNAVEERYLGVASSLPGFSRAVAQTIGTSVLGSLLALRIGLHAWLRGRRDGQRLWPGLRVS